MFDIIVLLHERSYWRLHTIYVVFEDSDSIPI